MKLGARIVTLARAGGIDQSVGYTVLARGWSGMAGLGTLLCIAHFLTSAEQGFYYAFSSLIGLQVFFELGLTFVLLQFASHEKAKLTWSPDRTLQGDEASMRRLGSLLRLALKWYGVVSSLLLLFVLPAGSLFFTRHAAGSPGVNWHQPWVFVVLMTAGSLFVSPTFAILEGTGKVGEVARMRTGQAILANIALWLALVCGFGLFASVCYAATNLIIELVWMLATYRRFFLDLFKLSDGPGGIDWRREVWPFQWRIALSWLSGYFMFQLFTPIAFALYGPKTAGQVGMSLSITTAVSAIALAWINTKSAPFGTLIANREFRPLDEMFSRAFRQSMIVAGCGCLAVWLGAYTLYLGHFALARRMLGPLPLGILLLAAILNQIVASEAIYLRAFKKEPFLALSLLNGCLVAISAFGLGRAYGPTGMMSGYLSVSLLGFFLGTWIFFDRRKLWRTSPLSDVQTRVA